MVSLWLYYLARTDGWLIVVLVSTVDTAIPRAKFISPTLLFNLSHKPQQPMNTRSVNGGVFNVHNLKCLVSVYSRKQSTDIEYILSFVDRWLACCIILCGQMVGLLFYYLVWMDCWLIVVLSCVDIMVGFLSYYLVLTDVWRAVVWSCVDRWLACCLFFCGQMVGFVYYLVWTGGWLIVVLSCVDIWLACCIILC